MIKNGVIALLVAVIAASVYRYIVLFREKEALAFRLNKANDEIASLVTEKQNLLQFLEKEKELQAQLSSRNAGLKGYVRAGKKRLHQAAQALNAMNQELEGLKTQARLLKEENVALLKDKEEVSQQNEALRTKLYSISGLKEALQELRKQAHKQGLVMMQKAKSGKIMEGNRGFLVKDGKPVAADIIKIEVIPAPSRQ